MYSTVIEPDFSRLHIKENVSACSSLRLAHFKHVLFPSLRQLLWLVIIFNYLRWWSISIGMLIFSPCCFSPSRKFLFLLDSFLLFDIIGHRQLILLLILQRSIYGFNIYHHEVFTLANIADFYELMEALSHCFEIFVHAFIKSWIYWTFDKFSGPRHHFKILAIGIFGVKVRQWDSSFISASGQHHVAVLRWEEVSAHVDGYLILLLHSTFCRDFIQHHKTLDVGILLLFFCSRWTCLFLSTIYCEILLLGLWLRCAVRCARIAPNKGSIMRISLLFEDICFAVNKHHCILSTKQWLITNLIVIIILESKLINSFVSILIKDLAIRCHSRKYLLELGILASILIILIFQAHHRMLIQIHRIFTLSHAIWHLQLSPGLQIGHMLRKVYQLVCWWNFIMLQLGCIWREHARPVEPLRLIQIICSICRIVLILIIASAIDRLIKGHRPRCAILSILDSSTFHDSCDILFIN